MGEATRKLIVSTILYLFFAGGVTHGGPNTWRRFMCNTGLRNRPKCWGIYAAPSSCSGNPFVALRKAASACIMHGMKIGHASALRICVWLLISLTICQAGIPDWDSGELVDADTALHAAVGVTRETYPDADAVWILSGQIARYRSDGTAEERYDAFAKVLTEKGRRELQSFRFGFNSVYGDVEVTRLVLFKPDGTAVPVDVERHSRVMVAPDQMQMNIYDPNQRVLEIGVPGLEVGDMIRVSGRRRITRARMPDTWADFSVFEGQMPVLEEWYEVHAPADRPLVHKRLRDEVPGTVSYEERSGADVIIHRWTFRNVPRIFEEPNMPETHTVVQRLLLSTIPDWPTVSRWYWELSRPRLEAVSPEMREKVRELTENASDREARLRAVFFYVARNIRYMGLTTETVAPGYEPRDVAGTFAARYGVCRDKAAVLVAMLRLAGFEAFPVLISVGPLMDEEVPLPYFNHAIVAVRQADGLFRLMDPTDETATDLFPAHLGHRSYLVATPEGEPLRVSPVSPADTNLVDIRTDARLAADGSLHGVSTLRFDGVNDDVYRGYFARLKPEERRRFFEGLIKRVIPGAVLTSFDLQPLDLRDAAVRLEARLEYSVPDAWIAGPETALPPVPWFGASVGMVNFVLGRTGLAKRRFPLVTEHTCGVRERVEVDLSKALGPPEALPPAVEITGPHMAWRQSLGHDADRGTLRGEAEFRIETVQFSPAEYLELKSALERIAVERRRRPIFRRGSVAADAPKPTSVIPSALGESADVEILAHSVEYEVASDSEWTITETVRKRVLTFAGLRSHAEIKIPFNPAWEDVRLEYARVTSPAGEKREIAQHEINLMDASWAASAPRYPSGKIFVANLPGVGVGHVIEYRLARQLRKRPFFHAVESFAGHDPMALRSVRLRRPDGLSLRLFAAMGTPAEEGNTHDDRSESAWTARDVPALPREDAQPPIWALAPTLFLSHPDGMSRYTIALMEKMKECADGESAGDVGAAARALAFRYPDRTDRLRAIRDAVARRVRRSGPALYEAPPDTLSAADITWRDGYGHSADAAIVLAAMLAAIGEEPQFVLVSNIRVVADALRGPMECFQPQFFPQVLVRVPFAGGWLYLNDTDQYAPLGATPSEGRLGLAAVGPGLEKVVIEPPRGLESGSDTHYRIELRDGSSTLMHITRRYRGAAHAAQAKRYAEMTPEERRRYHEELVAEIAQDARAVGELESRFDEHPGQESFSVLIPRYAVEDGPYLYMTLPPAGAGVPGVRADARATPLYREEFIRANTRIEFLIPPLFSPPVLAPENFKWISGGNFVETVFTSEPGSLSLTLDAEWHPAWVAAEAYAELLEVHRRLTHPRQRFVLLRRESGGASGSRP